ncbi:MAG: hypothetical protein JXR83_22010, partial [Deltaproteobacteria bacterium]|nr:hypothetical protein [Deltaproteobacteria bacterium]
LLLALSVSTVSASPVALPREEHLAQLKRLAGSDLERRWLDFLDQRNLPLPDEAQKIIERCNTSADFYYRDQRVAIFIDGPVHDQPDIAARDVELLDCLMSEAGLCAIRFHYRDDWEQIVRQHAYVFGTAA